MEHAQRMDVRTIELSAEELEVTCVHEDVTADRIVGVQFTPHGKVRLSTISCADARKGRKRIGIEYSQPAFISSVVSVRSLRFVEMTTVAAELASVALTTDVLGRLRPPVRGRPFKDLFCPTPTTDANPCEQYVFDEGANGSRFARLSLPDGVSIRSVRLVEEWDLLLAIVTDHSRNRSFIGAQPIGDLRVEHLLDLSSWQVVGRSPSGAQMVRLSRPRVSLASMGAAKILVVVGYHTGKEAVLSLQREDDKFRETWDEPRVSATQTLGFLAGTTDRTVTWMHHDKSVDIEIRDHNLSDPIIRSFARA